MVTKVFALAWYTSTTSTSFSTSNAQYKQPGDQQIKACIKTVRTKKDPRGSKLNLVANKISERDSSPWCQTIDRINSRSSFYLVHQWLNNFPLINVTMKMIHRRLRIKIF